MLNRSLNSVMARLGIVAAALALLALVAPVAFAASHNAVSFEENATGPVASFTATDADGEALSWSLKEDAAEDAATDYMKFDISTGGVLTFKSPPDFETKADIGGDVPRRTACTR